MVQELIAGTKNPERTREGLARAESPGAMTASIPARRIADVNDIADAVLFLCGDRARHIMGQVPTVDGGEGF